MNSWIGWTATGVFAVSYFVRDPRRMRLVQGLAAVLWMLYGIVIHALPIIVANLIVATLAVYSAFREASVNKAANQA